MSPTHDSQRATRNSPVCIGIIMDGNRRWARAQGLPTYEGHRKGYEKLRDVSYTYMLPQLYASKTERAAWSNMLC